MKTKLFRSHSRLNNVSKATKGGHSGQLRRPPYRLRPKAPIPFVSEIKRINLPDEAIDLFRDYRDSGFVHEYPSYTSLVYKLLRSRSYGLVDDVLRYMKKNEVRCRETLFVALIDHYGKAGMVDRALGVFGEMKDFDTVRSLQSLNAVLNALVDNSRLCDAEVLLRESRVMGFRPNSVSFNVIMKGWLKRGEWETARKMFDEMLERRVLPTIVTYNSLLGYLCRKGSITEALGLYEDMIKKGRCANAVTYALLMEGYCLMGRYDEARKLMFDMDYRGCKPGNVNYGVLMNDLVKRGEIEQARILLNEMRKRKVEPDVVMYNILITYLCKQMRAKEAYRILLDMQVEGCEPNAATYRMVVDGFCSVRDFEGGLKVLSTMLIDKHCPRVQTFGCLFSGLLSDGNLDGAFFVIKEMEKRKIRTRDVWESVISDCQTDVNGHEVLSKLVSTN